MNVSVLNISCIFLIQLPAKHTNLFLTHTIVFRMPSVLLVRFTPIWTIPADQGSITKWFSLAITLVSECDILGTENKMNQQMNISKNDRPVWFFWHHEIHLPIPLSRNHSFLQSVQVYWHFGITLQKSMPASPPPSQDNNGIVRIRIHFIE